MGKRRKNKTEGGIKKVWRKKKKKKKNEKLCFFFYVLICNFIFSVKNFNIIILKLKLLIIAWQKLWVLCVFCVVWCVVCVLVIFCIETKLNQNIWVFQNVVFFSQNTKKSAIFFSVFLSFFRFIRLLLFFVCVSVIDLCWRCFNVCFLFCCFFLSF